MSAIVPALRAAMTRLLHREGFRVGDAAEGEEVEEHQELTELFDPVSPASLMMSNIVKELIGVVARNDECQTSPSDMTTCPL